MWFPPSPPHAHTHMRAHTHSQAHTRMRQSLWCSVMMTVLELWLLSSGRKRLALWDESALPYLVPFLISTVTCRLGPSNVSSYTERVTLGWSLGNKAPTEICPLPPLLQIPLTNRYTHFTRCGMQPELRKNLRLRQWKPYCFLLTFESFRSQASESEQRA